MIRFECLACNAKIKVPEAKAGRKGKCPRCGQRLQVPLLARLVDTPIPPQIRHGHRSDESGGDSWEAIGDSTVKAERVKRSTRRVEQEKSKRRFTLIGAFVAVVFVLSLCVACGGLLDPWNVPHPGKSSYSSLNEIAKDFEAVYVVNPKTLNLSDEIQEVAIGISNKSEHATIYLRYLTKFQKFTADLLRERGHAGNPGVRYILESNRVKFDYGWNLDIPGFKTTRLSHKSEYTLTDKERYDGKSSVKRRGTE
jgi:hypothetical protein